MTSIAPGNQTVDPPRRSRALGVPRWLPRPTLIILRLLPALSLHQPGQLVDLPSAVIAAGLRAGLVPIERCVALLAAVRDGQLVARPSFFQLQQVRKACSSGVPMHLIAHEDVLIFVKGASQEEGTGVVA